MTFPYIGIDIGTTATKAVAFTPKGNVLYQTSRDYSMHHPQTNWSIQKPSEILLAVQECIVELEQRFDKLAFISFSAAMHSLLPVDERGEPLADCMLWADNRSIEEAEALRSTELGRRIYQKTGIPIHSFSPLTKLLWLKKHEPCLFQQTYKFISAKEYVWHALTGNYQVDSSMASGTGMMNLFSLQWDTEILGLLGITTAQLSTIVSPDYHIAGNRDQNAYVIGAGDGPLASLGTGAMAPHKMALTIGTSGAIRLPVSAPAIDPEMRTQCYHLINDQYLSLGAVNNGAVVLQWLKEKVLRTDLSYETLFAQAATVPAGAEGLLFAPYLLGERAPIWDAAARGSLLGLSIQHEQAHVVRAVLEGIVMGLRHVAEVLLYPHTDRSKIEIRASGGFAKSELWLQIVADIFQMRVALSQTVEGSAWGAVLLGCKALGLAYEELEGEELVFEPNLANKEVYASVFERFKKVYAALNI